MYKLENDDEMILCGCGTEWEGQIHLCPYRADINDDRETLCDCCAACEHECAMDI